MNLCTLTTLVLVSLITAYLYKVYYDLSAPRPVPHFDLDAYWGPGLKADHKPNAAVIPFTMECSKKEPNPLVALELALEKPLNLPKPLEEVGWEYGINSDGLESIVRWWRDDYMPRWGERKEYLSQYPRFTTEIQGLKIYFVHVKPNEHQRKNKTLIPLLMLHGWPGSIREYYGVIPQLVTANKLHDVVFEVIVPSLPGFGFSDASAKTGFGPAEIAIVMRNLMIRLGHKRFMIQGGDWGSLIGSNIATVFPDNVIAFHATACFISSPLSSIKGMIAEIIPSAYLPSPELAEYHFPMSGKFMFMMIESGYMHLQATKPDTIGTVLSNNPIGLLAYFVEKFSTWTKPHYVRFIDGGWSLLCDDYKNAILDNLMIYYLTNSITTSQRIYAEAFTFHQMGYEMDRVPTNVPFGYARFKNDLVHVLDWQITDKYTNLVHSTYLPEGGHFAAMEQTQMFVDDFSKFVNTVRNL